MRERGLACELSISITSIISGSRLHGRRRAAPERPFSGLTSEIRRAYPSAASDDRAGLIRQGGLADAGRGHEFR